MQTIASNLSALQARIEAACAAAQRDPGSVTLIGVSKTKPVAAVREAAALGVRHLGENYLDEAIEKIEATSELGLTWHFIGRVQSNKTRLIARYFDWVHTIDRLKVARRLHEQCPAGKRLNILLQINVDGDPDKAGVAPEHAAHLLNELCDLDNLVPRGLMTILARVTDPGAGYQSMAQLFARLSRCLAADQHKAWDTLSMGMTADVEQAIAAGATHIRIGTALFGERAAK